MKRAVRGRAARLARLVPARSGAAARTPFVLLVVVLLGTGLIALLLLNASLNQGSFQLSRLEKETDDLTDQQQTLQQQVDGYSAPDALDKRARELGMVPGGSPVFLNPDGTVPSPPASVSASADPSTAAAASPQPVQSSAAAPQPVQSTAAAPQPVPSAPAAPQPVPSTAAAPQPVQSTAAATAPEQGTAPASAPEATP
ncbi:septum formation initiator family protein [Streptomyces sp. NPDC004647]|uniref:septum formation initiator family protein n=1 Tax=Streptomyces sp. NPDC004647 TaxID=3154671 RepID=UPI0033A32DF4